MSGIGERIKSRRKAMGISAEELAEKIKVSPATMYRYENGDTEKVPERVLLPLALALNTTVNYLLGKRIKGADRPEDGTLTVTELRMYERQVRANLFHDLCGPAGFIEEMDEDANVTAWSPIYGVVNVTPEMIEDIMKKVLDYFDLLMLEAGRSARSGR